jgi:hypothetical protein
MLYLKRIKMLFGRLFAKACVKISSIADGPSARIHNKSCHEIDLLILDDYFPGVLTAFRVAEYNYYLEHIPSIEVHSTLPSNLFFNSSGSFQEKLCEYSMYYPDLKNKVKKFNKYKIPNCKLAYMVFINNAYQFIEYIDKHGITFAFTLFLEVDSIYTTPKLI